MRFALNLFGHQISLVPCSRLIFRASSWKLTRVYAQSFATTMKPGQATCSGWEWLVYWRIGTHWSVFFSCPSLQMCSWLSLPIFRCTKVHSSSIFSLLPIRPNPRLRYPQEGRGAVFSTPCSLCFSPHWLPRVRSSFSVWSPGGGIRGQVEMSLTRQCYDLISVLLGFFQSPWLKGWLTVILRGVLTAGVSLHPA